MIWPKLLFSLALIGLFRVLHSFFRISTWNTPVQPSLTYTLNDYCTTKMNVSDCLSEDMRFIFELLSWDEHDSQQLIPQKVPLLSFIQEMTALPQQSWRTRIPDFPEVTLSHRNIVFLGEIIKTTWQFARILWAEFSFGCFAWYVTRRTIIFQKHNRAIIDL